MSNLVEKREDLGSAKEKMQVAVHHMVSGVPTVVTENVQGFFVEHGETSTELEILINQEAIYQSFQRSLRNDLGSSSDQVVGDEKEAKEAADLQAQLAADEALARALQEEEDEVEHTSSTFTENNSNAEVESHSSAAAVTETAVTETPVSTETTDEVPEEDEVDPDSMNYEQLQSLEERMGSESKGLSEELISYLDHYKYKKKNSSSHDEIEECVICRNEYKKKEEMISLPCKHDYHAKCITRWLTENRACPICKEEVFG